MDSKIVNDTHRFEFCVAGWFGAYSRIEADGTEKVVCTQPNGKSKDKMRECVRLCLYDECSTDILGI